MQNNTDFIQVDARGVVGIITLNRPDRANSYTQTMLKQLDVVLVEMARDSTCRTIIISGMGRNFCGGADLDEIGRRDHRDAFELESVRVFNRLARYPKVTLAAVNGPAVGGGMELALSCDLRIACPETVFSLPEVSKGLIPAAGGTRRLPRLIGASRAKAIILGGQRLDAQGALDCGLVTELVEREHLLDAAYAWAAKIAEQDSLALRLAKEAIDHGTEANSGDSLASVSQALLYELAHRGGTL